MKYIQKYGMYAVILIWAIACFMFFNCYYQYHFFYQEQNQLFLLDWQYVTSYIQKPASIACIIGDFLTQFYYYLYAGPIILTVSLLTVGDFIRRGLQQAGLKHGAFVIAILVMTIEAICSFQPEYKLSNVIAVAGGAFMYWMYALKKRDSRLDYFFILLCILFTFEFFGKGVWIFAGMAIIGSLLAKRPDNKFARIVSIVIPMMLLMFTKQYFYLDYDKLYSYPTLGKLQKPDFLLEKDFVAYNEYQFEHYNKVVEFVEQSEEKTDAMKMYYYLAKAKQGQLPEALLNMKEPYLGTFEKIGPDTPQLTIKIMNDLYFALGDMTFAERAATMAAVFTPENRNVKMIQRLAECSIVSGDSLAAMKYLRLLQKTYVYKDWADAIARKEPKTFRYLAEKQQYVNRMDTLRLTDNSHLIMMQLLDSNPKNEIALDYILCSDLLLKDITNFKRDYDRYCMKNNEGRIRPLYQQALLIWLAGSNAPESEWQKYIKDKNTYERFLSYNEKRGSTQFADTYWYYFDVNKK